MKRPEIVARLRVLHGQAGSTRARADAFADRYAVPSLGAHGRAIATRAALESYVSELELGLARLLADLTAERRRAS